MVQVSFIIAAFNEERHIEKAVLSCLDQTYQNIEVVVVDDGSDDSTWAVLQSLKNKFGENLVIDQFTRNRGKIAAFNQAFKLSSGEFIAILGADDISVPDRVEFSLNQIGSYDLLCGDLSKFDDSTGQVLSESMMEENLGIKSDKEFDFNTLLEQPMVFGGTIFAQKQALNNVFPIDENIDHEDWWIPLCLSAHKNIRYCHKVLCRYRVHANQSTVLENRFSSYSTWRAFRVREIPYYEKILRHLISMTG